MRALIIGLILSLASTCWAGPELLFLAANKCAPPTPLHGTVTISSSSTWPTDSSMGTCIVPVTITVKGSGGGGGSGFVGPGTNGLATLIHDATSTWVLSATGGVGGTGVGTVKAANGTGSTSGSVSSPTTAGTGNLGGIGDYYGTGNGGDGGNGGYAQGTVTERWTAGVATILIGAGGGSGGIATPGAPGSVTISW